MAALLTEQSQNDKLDEAQKTINLYVQPGLGKERSTQAYDETCEKYDEYTAAFEYRGPAVAAELMGQLFPDNKQRQNVRILDVAAGTGLVGVELKKLGFTNIDALDPSEGMLRVARERGCYTHMYKDYIGEYELDIDSGAYDGITMSGGIGENMVPCAGFIEMTRIVKKGGFIVNVTRTEHLGTESYNGKLEPLLEQLERTGHWELTNRLTFPNFLRGKEGLALIHTVL